MKACDYCGRTKVSPGKVSWGHDQHRSIDWVEVQERQEWRRHCDPAEVNGEYCCLECAAADLQREIARRYELRRL